MEELRVTSLGQKIMLLKIGVNIIMGSQLQKEKNMLRQYTLLPKRANQVIHILRLHLAQMQEQLRVFHQMVNNLKLSYIHMANMKASMEKVMIFFPLKI